ncbi:MAG: acyl carrier protein [Rhodopirellula sp.]|nr:acyl carrier protein [Rhodopirellula sp.]
MEVFSIMGMDGVEIVMDVEQHFGISIQGSEAAQVRTVGDLVSLVHTRISFSRNQYCPHLAAFLTIRKATRAVCGDETLRIRPGDAVANILNARQRRELWTRLSDLLGTPPNSLRRPRLLRRLLAMMSSGLLLLALSSAIVIKWEILPLTIVLAGCVIASLYYSTTRFCCVPPDGWATFDAITNKLVSVSGATKMVHLRTDEDILNELRPLLGNVLGVHANAIVPSARFVEDLGMD